MWRHPDAQRLTSKLRPLKPSFSKFQERFTTESLSIDPAFFTANPRYSASDFTFAFGNGVDIPPSVSVPEPATLLLLTPILALALAATYRRQATLG